MSSTGINTLTTGTINGLNSLALDELTTNTFTSDTIDGNLIYYNKIEGNEIIVDTKLTLTSTGVISVGDKIISDIELTYLDGVSSNIQTQINAIAGAESNLQGQIDTHTAQITAIEGVNANQGFQINLIQGVNTSQSSAITALQLNDTQQDIDISGLESNDALQDAAIVSIQNINASQSSAITAIQGVNTSQSISITTLQGVNATQNTAIATLETKTQFQTVSSTATIFSKQINIPNGNIGYVNTSVPNDFYIQSNLALNNNIYLNSGLAKIYLQSQNVYLGKEDATTGRKSNLYMLGSNGINYEVQSSAFTENLKDSVINSAYAIASLQTKTQNITSADTTSTNMNKPIYVTSEADCVRMIGNQVFFTGWNIPQTIRHFAIGKETATGSRMIVINNMEGELLLTSGKRSGNANFGQNKIITQSTGISLRRGGRTDAEITVGEIGATGGTSATPDANLYINGNGVNNIYIDAGIGGITMSATGKINTISSGLVLSRTHNNVYVSGGEIGLINSTNNVFHIVSSGTNDIYMSSGSGTTTITTTNNINLSSNTVYIGSITPAGNGYKTNLNFLEASGYATQSSAFTETLKTQIGTNQTNITTLSNKFLNASAFGGNKGKITLVRNFQIMGQTALTNGQTYNGSTIYDVGAQLYLQYPGLFFSNGEYTGDEGDMNVSISFQFGFLCKNSSITIFKSYLEIRDTNNIVLDTVYTQGVHYNSASTLNNALYYNLGPIKHIMKEGDQIRLVTTYNLTAGNQGGYTMDSVFTIERNPL